MKSQTDRHVEMPEILDKDYIKNIFSEIKKNMKYFLCTY